MWIGDKTIQWPIRQILLENQASNRKLKIKITYKVNKLKQLELKNRNE